MTCDDFWNAMFFIRLIESCKLASERVVRRKPRVSHRLEEFAPHQRNGEEKSGRGGCGVPGRREEVRVGECK